jgi:hypothetical protein
MLKGDRGIGITDLEKLRRSSRAATGYDSTALLVIAMETTRRA